MFGKLHRSRKLDLTCPYCSHLQQEPAMVISSFCRACGEHFRVKKGLAIANPGLRVSGIAEVMPKARKQRSDGILPTSPAEADTDSEAWLITAEEKDSGARPLARAGEEPPEEVVGISAGAFFGLVEDDRANEGSQPHETPENGLGKLSQSRSALAQGSMGALIGSQAAAIIPDKDKMPPNVRAPDQRWKREEPVAGNPVRCFRCYHVQGVSRYAKSTQCERCNAYISLADYEIKTVKSHTLRTRGDVTIARKGGLVNDSEIACHHLTVNGSIDAKVDCTGEAVFRHSGVVRGHLFCERLVIEKNCHVTFPDGVMAKRAEINGRLVGNLVCSGKARIGKTGIVEGDVQAVEVDLKESGRISGTVEIDTGTTTELPLRKGFNPTVIG